MAFDGIVTKCIVAELNQSIINAKVNKIFEPTKNDILLGLYNSGINYCLHICINPSTCRINLTTHTKPNPISAPNFCMLLRKHLIGFKIISINSFDLDRIVKIDFEGYNELNDKITKSLYVEIMGSCSNIILTNNNNIIIDAIKHTNYNREIMPARFYELSTSNKHSLLEINSTDEFNTILSNTNLEEPIDKRISESFNGLCRPFVQYILNKNNNDLNNSYNHIKNIITNIDTHNVKCVNNR